MSSLFLPSFSGLSAQIFGPTGIFATPWLSQRLIQSLTNRHSAHRLVQSVLAQVPFLAGTGLDVAAGILPVAAATVWVLIIFLAPLLCFVVWFLSGASNAFLLLAFFFAYPLALNRLRPSSKQDYLWPEFRKLALWKAQRNYFPVNLIRTAELDPEKQYLFAVHPHGLFFVGPQLAIGSEACDWGKLFPRILVRPLVASGVLRIPFVREQFLWAGALDLNVCKTGDITMYAKKGFSFAIMPGGMYEAFQSVPGEERVAIRSRKGFVKLAIRFGFPLVPVYSFGESDLYEQLMVGHKWRERISRRIRIPIGWFRGACGTVVPRRVPLHVVVGAPISVEQADDPAPAEVDRVHEQYVIALCNLFDTHRAACGYNDRTLKIL